MRLSHGELIQMEAAAKNRADHHDTEGERLMTKEQAIKILEELIEQEFSVRTSEAYCMAIEALKQPEPRWIPCSERLPDNDVRVLMCTGRGYIHVGERDNRDIWNVGGYYLYEDCEVAAWMPLPQSYKKEKD